MDSDPLQRFDPFNDRKARDIRNTLSSALVADLKEPGAGHVDGTAAYWLNQRPALVYNRYIREQLRRYHAIIRQIRDRRVEDACGQALYLWNAGLFFELHELLETVWHTTRGPRRTALKGLIQAAGVYVHRACGNLPAARNLARRAVRNLRGAHDSLDFIGNLDHLVTALGDPTAPAPALSAPAGD